MTFSEETILEALRSVPDLKPGRNILDGGVVQDVYVDDQSISVTLEMPPVEATQKAELHLAIVQALQKPYPNAEVNVHFKTAAPAPTPPAEEFIKVKNIIAVGSGKGGVGKSTVSVNLAFALKELGARVGLMDADVYGPSIPTMLGLKGKRPQVKDTPTGPKMVPIDVHGVETISVGYIVDPEQAVVLRGPRLAAIIRQFFSDCLWSELDYLVIDLPPGTGDVQLTLVQTAPITGAVIVTTPQEVAVDDAIKAMNMFRLSNIDVPILGVVENMSWFTPTELPNNKYFIFGEGGGKKLAHEAGTVLLGQLPLVQSIRESGDDGLPAVLVPRSPTREYFLDITKNLLRQVAVRNETLPPTKIVGVGG